MDLFKHQADFIKSNFKHTALIGGYGSGKSIAGVLKTCMKLTENKTNCAYYLPTYSLIKDIAFPKFSETLTMLGIRFSINKSDKDILTPFGEIKLRSMDNPDLIVGYEVGYSLIDECDVLPTDKMNEIWAKVIGRNRAVNKNNNQNRTDLVGTPEGYKFAYNFFKTDNINRLLIKGLTENNHFLPKDYIDTLKDSYNEQQLLAYLKGEFVNLTSGNVYKEFNRDLHFNSKKINTFDTLHIGIDFNINNTSAVIFIIENNLYYAVDEITSVFDTYNLCEVLKKKYPTNKIVVYPDASGNNRKTNSNKTDFSVLKEYKFLVNSKNANPSVNDRINVANKLFRQKKIFIDKYKCATLVQALEQQTFDKNGSPDKSSGHDHILDAFGYMFCYFELKNNSIRILT
jgi:phage terminase large subunit